MNIGYSMAQAPFLLWFCQVKLDAPSGSSPLGMAIVLGRVVGDETAGPARDVILPTATEVILVPGLELAGSFCRFFFG